MSISQQLDIRQGQTLVMTPQLQQAIKLLQLSNQDLVAWVATEAEGNPFLESEDVVFSDAGTLSLSCHEAGPDNAEPFKKESGDNEPYDGPALPSTYDSSQDSRSAADYVADKPGLREHLLSQIHIDFHDPAARLVAVSLLELLDEAGYLPFELELVRAQMGVTPAFFESVIERLQRMDPPGIFARSLRECLSIQLQEKNRLDPAMVILIEHLDLVGKRDYDALKKLCGVDAEDLGDMIDEVRALDPKPALVFASDVAPPLVPDVILVPLPGGNWHVELNNDTLPRVLVNEAFYTKIMDGAPVGEDKAYLSERWQQANWLVKALHQRATTILKVATEIVKQQDKFFVYGVQHLKPLILKDIADAVEMHESTVSRVTQNKYITTPRGLFELKYFFSGALASTGGNESVSTLAVRERLKELIAAEKPDAILSDDKIMEKLRAEGIDIARRTVAKYREALGIPTSGQRRREKRTL